LFNIFKNKAYSTIELNKQLEENVEAEDKALVTRIVYGVLENNLQLEYVIGQFAKRRPTLNTYIILKMGTYAHMKLNSIPNYAIVNELVDLTKTVSKYQEAGFVNKVLKNITQNKFSLPEKTEGLKYLSVKYSYPMWLLKKLEKQYGKKALESLIKPTKRDKLKNVRINLNKTTTEGFKQLLLENEIKFRDSVYDNAVWADYAMLMTYDELFGLYAVQSVGSMLIVNSFDPGAGDKVLDVCAAPGGKTCYIAEKNKDINVLALDIHPHRVELVKKYASSMGLKNIKTKLEDATIYDESKEEQFDFVLCDVPCTGIGIVSKKPDILLFRKEEDIADITKLQLNILQTAKNYVKVSGELIYSTCTILKEENIKIINKFLKLNDNFEIKNIEVDNLKTINENGTITLLPDKNNYEGYFVCKLIKKG
jgi:16S rRNA (cytosine967-C5)-methyltransferase